MSNELAKQDESALAKLQEIAAGQIQQSDDVFDTISKSGDYLCRLQLCGSNSKLFKRGKIGKGHYGYIVTEDTFTDLGLSVDILPICWRPKALDMSGETPVQIFDINSPEFKDISARSMLANSECTFGPEFLVWVPSIKKFASLHFGSKTSRKDAPDLRKLLMKGATLTHRIIETERYVWEAMSVGPCSTPFEIPTEEAFKIEVDKFNTQAQQKAPERADTNTSGRAR